MDRFCPICKLKLTEQPMNEFMDYFCNPTDSTHHYSERLKEEEVIIFKARISKRFQLKMSKMYFKVNKLEGYTEIWEGTDNPARVRIDQVMEPNFTDLEALRNKLKTYMVFS